jgi:hypothetical protein
MRYGLLELCCARGARALEGSLMAGRLLAPLFAVALLLPAGCGDDGVSAELGARCGSHADCANRCLLPSDEWPGGFCTRSCSRSEECPSGSGCADEEGGVCLFFCRDDRECDFLGTADGRRWVCEPRDGLGGPDIQVCVGDD